MSGLETREVLSNPVLLKVYLSCCVLTGVLMCFYGNRAFKFVLGLLGVVIGGYLAAAIGYNLSEGSTAVALFCGATGGALGGVLMVALYLLGVFVIGAALGGVVGAVFTVRAGTHVRAVTIAVLAAIGGFLGLFFQRMIIIAATAVNGAALVTGGMWMLYHGVTPTEVYALHVAARPGAAAEAFADPIVQKYLLVGAWAALACVGAWVQFAAGEKTARPPRDPG